MPDFPYVISHFKQHKELKKPLLNAIKKQKLPPINNAQTQEIIFKTDWYTTGDKSYIEILYEPMTKHMIDVFKSIKINDPVYQFFWFTQYKKNNTFGRHDHRKSTWVSIYYLDLPKNTPITNFINVLNDDIFVPNIIEGDIITFPGFVIHWSPINTSNKTKTVISFNVI